MIRRSPIRHKKRVRRVMFPSGKVVEDSAGMATLRSLAFKRSGGKCECRLENPERTCTRRVNWYDGQLHHLKPRSDVLERVAFVNRECHREIHGKPAWTPNWLKEWSA